MLNAARSLVPIEVPIPIDTSGRRRPQAARAMSKVSLTSVAPRWEKRTIGLLDSIAEMGDAYNGRLIRMQPHSACFHRALDRRVEPTLR